MPPTCGVLKVRNVYQDMEDCRKTKPDSTHIRWITSAGPGRRLLVVRSVTQTQALTMFGTGLGIARV